MGIPIFFVMQALRTVIMTIMGATFTRVVSSTSTTMYIGIPAGVSNSPESHNIRLVFPISPNGYYDGDEVPIINERPYGNHASPESNYDSLVYGAQNDGIIDYRYTDNIPCSISINPISIH